MKVEKLLTVAEELCILRRLSVYFILLMFSKLSLGFFPIIEALGCDTSLIKGQKTFCDGSRSKKATLLDTQNVNQNVCICFLCNRFVLLKQLSSCMLQCSDEQPDCFSIDLPP